MAVQKYCAKNLPRELLKIEQIKIGSFPKTAANPFQNHNSETKSANTETHTTIKKLKREAKKITMVPHKNSKQINLTNLF